MPFLVSNHCRPQLVSNYKSCRNSLGPNVGRALVEDGHDVVLLGSAGKAGPAPVCKALKTSHIEFPKNN